MTRGTAVARDPSEPTDRNPCKSVGRIRGPIRLSRPPARAPYERPTMHYLNREDALAYLEACEDWYRPLAEVLLGAGLRIGEAIALEWRDVDWDGSALEISRSRRKRALRRLRLRRPFPEARGALSRGALQAYPPMRRVVAVARRTWLFGVAGDNQGRCAQRDHRPRRRRAHALGRLPLRRRARKGGRGTRATRPRLSMSHPPLPHAALDPGAVDRLELHRLHRQPHRQGATEGRARPLAKGAEGCPRSATEQRNPILIGPLAVPNAVPGHSHLSLAGAPSEARARFRSGLPGYRGGRI